MKTTRTNRQQTIDCYTREACNINNSSYLDSTIITFEKENYYYFMVFIGKKLNQLILTVQRLKILERSLLTVLKK
jgi:hypothetical protein